MVRISRQGVKGKTQKSEEQLVVWLMDLRWQGEVKPDDGTSIQCNGDKEEGHYEQGRLGLPIDLRWSWVGSRRELRLMTVTLRLVGNRRRSS